MYVTIGLATLTTCFFANLKVDKLDVKCSLSERLAGCNLHKASSMLHAIIVVFIGWCPQKS
jgi:hypothetical protein